MVVNHVGYLLLKDGEYHADLAWTMGQGTLYNMHNLHACVPKSFLNMYRVTKYVMHFIKK